MENEKNFNCEECANNKGEKNKQIENEYKVCEICDAGNCILCMSGEKTCSDFISKNSTEYKMNKMCDFLTEIRTITDFLVEYNSNDNPSPLISSAMHHLFNAAIDINEHYSILIDEIGKKK